ncbi:N-methylhydantoinase A/oxoprolinase/acetone carboxylase, beta subunit [Geosmithia morbida]|uniref:N-methylhydantoinase A/oxoprolinase/acetone carboxylase, beta subunit n=1 Tax=Geosmithia morbida TaxID=1094350 RepID=A0A9P4YZU9_9HYPO|nr:N-methylhydantoinase A/oxoprolinase/acetone carboxylase, beta subunit [Geosmithia morbida]KAF4126096.1 N-methylhydantoinase A/oxoprolinase/acetone carboxylase, beta subunit [Geosmithia morbida]
MTRPNRLRVGIDVGGTNTDGVVLDPAETNPDASIKAWHKTATTPDPSDGIDAALSHMFDVGGVDPSTVSSVTIGTTHFVNAVVEADASRLSPVAVIRLCGPFSKHVPPCVDWNPRLSDIILGHYALLKGGLQVDGLPISDISEEEIRAECAVIREKGISNIVVNGVFSPIDTIERQEERAADIVRAEIPSCNVVCSKDVANIGFIERENAAILNASILTFAKKTIRSFQRPIRRLGLKCPLYIAQNDGTILSGEGAAQLPIRTFSSGPTNSMRGAAFLVQRNIEEDVMVVDIGGTTTDVGLLEATGFPRQRAAYSELEGVRVNFPGPDIKSIGLGGGSIVRPGAPMTVGPDSVGHKLSKESVVFGGSTLTATDLTVLGNSGLDIGDRALLQGKAGDADVEEFRRLVKKKLENIIDMMKTSPADIPVILVGGGAVVAPESLRGASKVTKPNWSQVANAVGAAMARVSGIVDTVMSTESKSIPKLLEVVKEQARARTIEAGAKPSSVDIAEVDTLPLTYVSNMTRFIVRAVGDVDPSKNLELPSDRSDEVDDETGTGAQPTIEKNPKESYHEKKEVDIDNYKPDVRGRVWYISETDLEWISTGCYILGTGGGGSPYSSMIRLRAELRKGAVVRVVDTKDLADDAQVGCGGAAGSPTVAVEKLGGDETLEAQQELYKICDKAATHLIAVEIGGANGLQSLIIGASTHMNIPVVDGDWMGRAYPTKWQTTPVVFNERSPIWCPIVMSDGSGNVLVMPKAASDTDVDRIFRSALSQMGSQVGIAEAPVTGAETRRWAVQNTISQAWRIGRGVARVRAERRTAQVAESILQEFGGASAGKVIWKGKIIGVERVVRSGYAYGECLIQGADVTEDGSSREFQGLLRVPFKNENIAAIVDRGDGQMEGEGDVLATVPDLITIIDAQNGEAVGTPEYRYGLLVVVLGIAASDKWTGSERGIKIGGPEGFGFGHLKYSPLGEYHEPLSVIDEFDMS